MVLGNSLGIFCAIMFLGGLQVDCGQPASSCATQEKITEINTFVAAFQSKINAISSMGLSQLKQYELIFGEACNNATYKTQLEMISVGVTQCIELVTATSLVTLSLGSVSFLELIAMFPAGGIQGFCACSPYLPGALILGEMKSSYSLVVNNGEYPTVANLPFFCTENMMSGQEQLNIRAILNMTLAGLDTTCPNVNQLAGMSSKKLSTDVQQFIKTCDTFDAVKFQCAMNGSSTANFKSCLNNAGPACGKYNCINQHIGESCGSMAGMSYIRAVNMEKGMAEFPETRDNTCSAAGPISVSITVVLVSALLCFLI